ncbi:MAG: trigger factor [Nitrospirae bacterium]|nr:trigger factor [Nitrospirota bacterium]
MLNGIEETAPTIRKLKINIPSSVIDEEISRAYDKLRVTARIPGFRVGKAPQAILEKKFSSAVEHDVLEKIVPEFYSKAVEEAKLMPLGYPHIDGDFRILRNQSISFTATVEIKPELKDLDYEGIAITEKTISVEDKDIESAMKALHESRAILKVAEGNLKDSDVAILDCDAFIDGKEIKELALKDYPLILGSGSLPKEFSDILSGKKKGDIFDVKINFDPSFANKAIAGKDVLFKGTVTETKEKVLPALDDEFAKGFNTNSIEELRKKLRENILSRKKSKIDNEYKKELLDHLINNHNFEVPASLVMREVQHLTDESKENAMSEGRTVKPDEELKKDFEPAAIRNAKGMIILEAIGRKENIAVNEDDIDRLISEIAAQNDLKPEEVKKLYIMRDGSLDGLRHRLYSDKVLDLVLAKAVIK